MNTTFRARHLDISRPIEVIRSAKEVLSSGEGIARDVPIMPTGMEEEEENESHIRMALMSRRRADIPTPIVNPAPSYLKIHTRKFSQSGAYIRSRGV